LVQYGKRRHHGGHRQVFQSDAEDQDVALFHLQKWSVSYRRAAETHRLIQCDVPPLDRHVTERSEREQQRSRTKVALPAETRTLRVVAFRVGQPRLHDFDTMQALQERLLAKIDA